MASLIGARDKYDIATGNDADTDRHGIVTPDAGLMNPNHYLAVAIDYLFRHRTGWSPEAGVGKTLVSSSIIDRVAASLGRELVEVPVGFKWFVPGLMEGSIGFGGEESAGASFLRTDGSVWSTDKDGIILALLASEITARTGKTPSQRYAELTADFGAPVYQRIDAPATREQKAALKQLSPAQVEADTLAGEQITAKLTNAPGNGAAIGGLKVTTKNAWFAARPSGTEDVYKIYAESFLGEEHLAIGLEGAGLGEERHALVLEGRVLQVPRIGVGEQRHALVLQDRVLRHQGLAPVLQVRPPRHQGHTPVLQAGVPRQRRVGAVGALELQGLVLRQELARLRANREDRQPALGVLGLQVVLVGSQGLERIGVVREGPWLVELGVVRKGH
jgi:hypothetical protein